MISKDEALKMAIEALELCDGNGLKDYDFCIAIHKCKTALNACKAALDTEQVREGAVPAQQPLSDEEISLMAHNDDSGDWNDLRFRDCWYEGYKKGARAIEKAHGIEE